MMSRTAELPTSNHGQRCSHRPPLATYLLPLFAFALAGCRASSQLRTLTPVMAPSDSAGIRYYQPRDLLLIEATSVLNLGRGWNTSDASEKVCSPGPARRTIKSVTTSVKLATAADTRVAYRLVLGSSRTAAENLKLGLTSEGLLTSASYSVEDKRAEIAGSVLKSLAGLAGTVVGVDALIPGGFKAATDVAPAEPRTRGERCAAKIEPELMASLFDKRQSLEREVESAMSARGANLAGVLLASSPPALKLIQSRDSIHDKRIILLDSRLANVRDAITARVAKATADSGVTAKDSAMTTTLAFDLTAIPGKSIVENKLTSRNDAAEAIAEFREMKRLLDSAGVLFTLDEAETQGPHPDLPTLSPPSGKPGSGDCSGQDRSEKCVIIYTRQPRSRVLRLYVPTGGASTAPLALREMSVVNAVSSADRVIAVPFSTRTLGQKSFTLTFARPGTLTGIEHSSTAALANASSTLAAALAGARDEFTKGLASVQTSQASIDAIQQASRTARIKELQDRKTLLDAELSLQGATASRDLIAQKKQLEAELELLRAQEALATYQKSTVSSTEVAEMKAELERLKAELELLKARAELEKAKGGSGE